jgi:hypothetical protein
VSEWADFCKIEIFPIGILQKILIRNIQVSQRVWYIFKSVIDPQVKVLQNKKISVLSLTVWVQEQFEKFAKTIWESLETANINSMKVGCFFVDTFLTFFFTNFCFK